MTPFIVGHAMHPQWQGALALAAAQVDAGLARAPHATPTLGFVYLTDPFAAAAEELLAALRQRWPGVAWVGTVGIGVATSGVEYFDEPALVLMLAPLPVAQFEVFSGAHRLQRLNAACALVHADGQTPDLAELIAEMSGRTSSGYVFGGVAASRTRSLHIADGVWQGGLSGVAFGAEVGVLSRVTQGCQPVGPVRRVTAAEGPLVVQLDGRPALACLLQDLGLAAQADLRAALPRLQGTLAGLADADDARGSTARAGQFGIDTRVRHLIGVDPGREAVAVAEAVQPGMTLAFCRRDMQAARRDLVRICSEIRDEVESLAEAAPVALPGAPPEVAPAIRGALYVSCSGRGGPHFGGPSAELQIVRHALGDVPLVGFFAGGEIAVRHLYGYTGVLTVWLGAP